LGALFKDSELRPIVLIGAVAHHLKCGLVEAEKILERLQKEGAVREATAEEKAKVGATFGYVATTPAPTQLATALEHAKKAAEMATLAAPVDSART